MMLENPCIFQVTAQKMRLLIAGETKRVCMEKMPDS